MLERHYSIATCKRMGFGLEPAPAEMDEASHLKAYLRTSTDRRDERFSMIAVTCALGREMLDECPPPGYDRHALRAPTPTPLPHL